MLKELLTYGFEPAGRIFLNKNNRVDFEIDNPKYKNSNAPLVYAQVNGEDILYIGRAGKGIKKRLSEHRGGWRRQQYKEDKIRQKLETGGDIKIYCRFSDYFRKTIEVLGEKKEIRFSLKEEEEGTLLKKFQPVWNRNGLK